MTRLPFLISVPHAGMEIPSEAQAGCLLDRTQILLDSDEGAAQIYALEEHVQEFITTDIARAVVDLNRAPDDLRADGVIKTQTSYLAKVWAEAPSDSEVKILLDNYYYPYHLALTELASDVTLGIDCHTMAAEGPPIGPGAGIERPPICLSNAGVTCPESWLEQMAHCLEESFAREISINEPFRGGHIVRSHASELPWMQLELSRAPFLSIDEKASAVSGALSDFASKLPIT